MGGLVTTFQPNAILNPHNTRTIRNPMRQKQRTEILDGHCYVFNITPQTYPPIYRTHGVYQIFGNEAIDIVPEDLLNDRFGFGELEHVSYSWTKINGRIELVENGIESGRGVSYDEVATEAELIAQDIVAWCNENRPGVGVQVNVESFLGIFWEPGENGSNPSKRGILSAKKKLTAYYKSMVEAGDQIFMENRDNPNPLKDRPETIHKVAFKTLKEWGILRGEKPWVYEVSQAPEMATCKACHTAIALGALRCPHCHAFQTTDLKLLREFYPVEFPAPQPPAAK